MFFKQRLRLKNSYLDYIEFVLEARISRRRRPSRPACLDLPRLALKPDDRIFRRRPPLLPTCRDLLRLALMSDDRVSRRLRPLLPNCLELHWCLRPRLHVVADRRRLLA